MVPVTQPLKLGFYRKSLALPPVSPLRRVSLATWIKNLPISNRATISTSLPRHPTLTLISRSIPLQLPDGYHELAAVAYEGSHVRTQTRATVPVCISNSPL